MTGPTALARIFDRPAAQLGLMLLVGLVTRVSVFGDLSYFSDRLNFSEEAQNLSTLVYLQGWQSIAEAWELTHGIGRGFQQMGVFGTDVPAAELIRSILEFDLNLFDGGFTFSKILTEFGVFGAIMVAAYAAVAIHAAAVLRGVSMGTRSALSVRVLSASFIVGYAAELLLRGAGYFTPTGLLLIASLWIWRNRIRHRRPRTSKIIETQIA